MNREVKNYFLNIIKKESFYIDIISTITGCAVIALTAISFYTGEMRLLKLVFVLALLITLMNSYKSYKISSPMRFVYGVFSVILIGVCIYAVFNL